MKPDFKSSKDGLLPAIIQDSTTGIVLMLGYMNHKAFEKTQKTKLVTFYSRKRKTLWTKGETSGNYIEVKDILIDCDNDSILIKAKPRGVVCHKGNDTCFNEKNENPLEFLTHLEMQIHERKQKLPNGSYTTKLFNAGIEKITQKFGEESIELIIEACLNDKKRFKEEAADLVYHLLVLLIKKGVKLKEVVEVLKKRGS